LYHNDPETWHIKREALLVSFKGKNKSDLIIRIYIEEESVEELFDYLKEIVHIETYNLYLSSLLRLSEKNTIDLYKLWLNNYLKSHFGEASKDFLAKNLNIIGSANFNLRKKLEQNIKKNFTKRPSLKT